MATFETTGTFSSGILIGDPSSVGTPPQPTTVGTGINETQVNAALEIKSTTGGIMPPRMTTAQIQAISVPAIAGQPSPMGPVQLIFNTDTQGMVTVLDGNVNGTGNALVGSVKRWTMTYTGATQINAIFANQNANIQVNKDSPYFPRPIAANVYFSGTRFTALPATLEINISLSTGDSLNFLTVGVGVLSQLMLSPNTKNACTMAPAGFTNGGTINASSATSSLVASFVSDGALTNGDATSTLRVEVFYI